MEVRVEFFAPNVSGFDLGTLSLRMDPYEVLISTGSMVWLDLALTLWQLQKLWLGSEVESFYAAASSHVVKLERDGELVRVGPIECSLIELTEAVTRAARTLDRKATNVPADDAARTDLRDAVRDIERIMYG